MYPADYRYTKEHEWIKVSGETGTIGITLYAQHELGDVVFVELPDIGAKLKAGDVIGTIESVKAVSEIYAPVSGVVLETNGGLSSAPEKVNTKPLFPKRKPRPDALSSQGRGGAPRYAGGHRGQFH